MVATPDHPARLERTRVLVARTFRWMSYLFADAAIRTMPKEHPWRMFAESARLEIARRAGKALVARRAGSQASTLIVLLVLAPGF